jgi:hypothetical protein
MLPLDSQVMEVALLEIIDKKGSSINLMFAMMIY